MTDDTMNLQALMGKSANADFLCEMIGFDAQRQMNLEVGSLTGAGYGEKSSDRLPSACFPTMLRIAGTLAGSAQRNRYRERDW